MIASVAETGARDGNRTRTPPLGKAADFKSAVSTSFTTRAAPLAMEQCWSGKRGSNSRPQPWQGCALPTELFPHGRVLDSGGAEWSRTTLDGFAIRCITALLPRPQNRAIWSGKRGSNSRPQPWQGCALPTELFPHLSPNCSTDLVFGAARRERKYRTLLSRRASISGRFFSRPARHRLSAWSRPRPRRSWPPARPGPERPSPARHRAAPGAGAPARPPAPCRTTSPG